MNYSIENLKVWHASRDLIKDINQVTSTFLVNEKFGISDQLKSTSVSMNNNILAGSLRWSKKSQTRYYGIAFDDLIDVLNQLTLATYLKCLEEDQLTTLRSKIDRIVKLLNTLCQSTHHPISSSSHQLINLSKSKP